MKIISIILCVLILALSSISCATTASNWTQKETKKYKDEEGNAKIEVVEVKYMKIQGSGKADFKNETIDGKVELIPKELVTFSGTREINE